jgi:hypothetical protein
MFFRCLLTTIAVLTISSTIYHFFEWKFGLKSRKALKTFSIADNLKKLVNIKESESVIKCIDGMKVISGENFSISRQKITQEVQLNFPAILIVAGHRKQTLDDSNIWNGWNPYRDVFMGCVSVKISTCIDLAFNFSIGLFISSLSVL